MNIINDFYQTVIYDNRYLFILEGLKNTLLMAFFAVVLGIIIGLIVSVIRNYHEQTGKLPILYWLGRCYVTVIRGTPSILHLMIIYYVIFAQVDINILIVGTLAFGINSGAYVAEIIRAGLDSVPKGEIEAGKSLGLSYSQILFSIIFPPAFKNALPGLGNELITLVKETSIGAYIGILELTKSSDIIASRTYNYFFPLIIIAMIYLCITLFLTKLESYLERKIIHD